MKKPKMINLVYWLLYLGLLIGCQPDQIENTSNIPPTNTSVVSILEEGSDTGSDTKATSTSTPIPAATSIPEATPFSTVAANSQITLTTSLRQDYMVTPLGEGIVAAIDVQWMADGQSLIYSLTDAQWPAHVSILPVYQSWWQYNVSSDVTQALPLPQTRVTNATREALGICPFPYTESNPFPYPCDNTLQESSSHNRIVFSSGNIVGEANTWLANIDGSDVVYLENFPGTPEDVRWSSNGRWLLIGYYAGVNGSRLYYLVSQDGTNVKSLEELTNTSQWLIQGATPQFSSDGQYLAFAGIEANGEPLSSEQLNEEEAYNLYVLDLNTLESELVSPRFGMFQWAPDRHGLYVLDGSANTAGNSVEYILNDKVNYADLYFIDLSQETYPEQKLGGDIPIELPYSGAWSYSPEAQAIAGTFNVNGPVFGVLFLNK